METTRISNNKYIQLVRIGESYVAIAVCKDTVTLLGEIPKEQLKEGKSFQSFRFKDFLDKAAKKTDPETVETEESQSDDKG